MKLSVLVFLLALSIVASGQVTGTITGSVMDPAGASVPKAKVEIMLAGGARAVAATATSTEGLFSLETLRPEYYDLSVTAPGFVVYKIRGVKVDPARATDLPAIKLELASTATSVDVKANVETVQVTSTEISTTVTAEQIRQLPVGDRGPLAFVQTQAGAAPTQYETDINGQRSSFTSVTLDGINVQDNYIRTGGVDFLPNQLFLDQVNEFTVNTSNASSTQSGASQVNFSTPSGTNQYHGHVVWQNRNNSVAANNWFNNQDGIHLPRLVVNQGGPSLGGPILHDKLFFYTNYEFYRYHSETSVDQTILTSSARQGIFKYVDSHGQVQQANLLDIVGLKQDPVMAALLAQVPGPEKINNFRTGDSQPGRLLNTAGYSFPVRNNVNEDNATGKLDYNLSTRHTLVASFAWNREFVDRPDSGVGYSSVPPVYNDQATKFLSAAWRFSPSATFTNEVRGGLNFSPAYFINSEKLPSYLVGGTIWSSPVATAGPNGLLPQGRDTRTYSIQDNANWVHGRHTISFGYQMQAVRVNDYDYFGTVPFYNVGASSSQQQSYLLGDLDLPGIGASDLDKANLLLASLTGILDNANVYYNVTNRTSGFVAGAPYRRNWTFDNHAFYGTDTWKIMRRLSLTMGLRWDYYAPANERDALLVEPQLIGGDARVTMLNNASLNFVGNSIGKPLYNKDLNNFAPNVGLAWDVFGTGKTSVRAGYSVHFVNDENRNIAEVYPFTNPGLLGYNFQFDLSGFIGQKLPPLPAPKFQIPLTFADGYANNPSQSFALIDPGLRTPYVQEWNFSIQHDLKGNIIEARYIGNHATKLLRAFDYNQEDIVSNGFLADFLRAQNNGFLALKSTGTFNPAFQARIPGSQPLPVFNKLFKGGFLTDPSFRTLIQNGEAAELGYQYQVNGINGSVNFFPNPNALEGDYVTNYSNSIYDSLQLEVRRRLQNGLSVQANYTFSKWLSDQTGIDQNRFEPFLDINNPTIDRARVPVDLTHQFKANYVYELPLGPGHRISRHGLDRLLGGWSTSGNAVWVTGIPFTIYSGFGTFLREDSSGSRNTAVTTLTGSQLSNLVGFRMTGNGPYFINSSAIGSDGRAVAPAGSAPFNGQVFFNPTAGTVGTLQKRMFNGPNIFGMDAALGKKTKLTERIAAELRVEALNVFNHPTFTILSSTRNINSSQFGKVVDSTFIAPRRLQFVAQLSF